jgi:GR25 family glycosyltransferase involved in LPS biosynthesis
MNKKINVERVYLINLDRRRERLDHFYNECKRDNIDLCNVEIFKAYDAKHYEIKKNELEMFKNSDFLGLFHTNACICNQLSHYYILKDILKKKYKKCIIFQDDVKFKNNFRVEVNKVISSFPKNAEIVWLGIHKKAAGSYFEDYPLEEKEKNYSYVKEKINKYICRYNDDVNPCSLAYIITYEGAKNYIDYVEKNGFFYSTDNNFNHYLISKGIMYGSYDILCTGNSKFKSDVFTEDDNALTKEMLEILGL